MSVWRWKTGGPPVPVGKWFVVCEMLTARRSNGRQVLGL
jgi:hypothetical protein